MSCDWEPVPSVTNLALKYRDLWSDVYYGNYSRQLKSNHSFLPFGQLEILTIISIVLLIGSIRSAFFSYIQLMVKSNFSLSDQNLGRTVENCWHFFQHSVMFVWQFYVVIIEPRCSIQYQPSKCWSTGPESVMTSSSKFLHLTQIGIVMYNFYGVCFVFEKRKDYTLFLIHHGTTCALLLMSYTIPQSHVPGMFVLLVHESCDIFLDLGRINTYLSTGEGKYRKIRPFTIMANTSFILFMITWCVLRLYWFPLKAIYCVTLVPRSHPGFLWLTYAHLFLNILLILNIWWFIMILQVFKNRIISGRLRDTTASEFSVQEHKKSQRKSH